MVTNTNATCRSLILSPREEGIISDVQLGIAVDDSFYQDGAGNSEEVPIIRISCPARKDAEAMVSLLLLNQFEFINPHA